MLRCGSCPESSLTIRSRSAVASSGPSGPAKPSTTAVRAGFVSSGGDAVAGSGLELPGSAPAAPRGHAARPSATAALVSQPGMRGPPATHSQLLRPAQPMRLPSNTREPKRSRTYGAGARRSKPYPKKACACDWEPPDGAPALTQHEPWEFRDARSRKKTGPPSRRHALSK
jgi:hypothetical protein